MELMMGKMRLDDSGTGATMLRALREFAKLVTAPGRAPGFTIEASSLSELTGRFACANAGASAHASGTRCASNQSMNCCSRSLTDKALEAPASGADWFFTDASDRSVHLV